LSEHDNVCRLSKQCIRMLIHLSEHETVCRLSKPCIRMLPRVFNWSNSFDYLSYT